MGRHIGFLALACLIGLSGCTVTKRGYLEKGNKLYAAGKYADASIIYRKAIQRDPLYGEAYYRLGLAAIKQDDGQTAYEALIRATQLLPDNVDAKEKLSGLALGYYLADPRHPQSFYRQLSQLSQELLAKNPGSFEGWRVKGYLAITDRKPADAILYFRKALQVKNDPVVKTALAEILIQNGQPQEGEQTALQVVSEAKAYGPAYNVLYTLYVSSKRMNDAEKILQAKVANNPKNPTYIVQLAEHYADHQDSAAVARTLQQLLDRPKDFPQARLQVADFYSARKNFTEAARYYQEGIQANLRDKVIYQQRYVGLLLKEGKNGEATDLLNQILKDHPNDPPTVRMRALVWVDHGDATNLSTAIGDLQTLVQHSPDDRFLRFKLGQALRRKGDLDAATDQLIRAIKDRKDFREPRFELAEIALQRGQGKQAVQYASEVLAINPTNRGARLLHAMGLMSTGDYGLARDELTGLIKEDPRNDQARLQLGRVLMLQKNYQQAAEIFDKLRQGSAAGLDATAALASTYASENQLDKAQQVLTEGLKTYPDSASLRGELAVIDARAGKYDAAITEFQQALAREPKSERALLALGDVYDLKGDLNSSIATFHKAQAMFPKDPTPALSEGDALKKAGRFAEAAGCYEGILKTDPNNVTAINNLAFLLADNPARLDEAMKLAQRAIQLAPQQPDFMDTLGYVYLKKNLLDSAFQTFTVLVQKYPSYPTFRYHLGLAWLAKGERAKANTEFKAALAAHPSREDQAKINELLRGRS